MEFFCKELHTIDFKIIFQFTYNFRFPLKLLILRSAITYFRDNRYMFQGHTEFSQDSRWSSHNNELDNASVAIDAKTGKVVSVHNTLRSRTFRETSFR
ncbi:hypothetical protein M9Y10_002739 [Tritrichomonas musculus]|uniref:Uncharacterized protein n=1 Tax=Tritrichomonas musculus TaxID=1915356 RepID=A0ABR2LAN6_9EUKA